MEIGKRDIMLLLDEIGKVVNEREIGRLLNSVDNIFYQCPAVAMNENELAKQLKERVGLTERRWMDKIKNYVNVGLFISLDNPESKSKRKKDNIGFPVSKFKDKDFNKDKQVNAKNVLSMSKLGKIHKDSRLLYYSRELYNILQNLYFLYKKHSDIISRKKDTEKYLNEYDSLLKDVRTYFDVLIRNYILVVNVVEKEYYRQKKEKFKRIDSKIIDFDVDGCYTTDEIINYLEKYFELFYIDNEEIQKSQEVLRNKIVDIVKSIHKKELEILEMKSI
jgi:hypothetical protein